MVTGSVYLVELLRYTHIGIQRGGVAGKLLIVARPRRINRKSDTQKIRIIGKCQFLRLLQSKFFKISGQEFLFIILQLGVTGLIHRQRRTLIIQTAVEQCA